jgi:hypothetical protein
MKISNNLDECGCNQKVKAVTGQEAQMQMSNSQPEGAHYKKKLKNIIEDSYLIHQLIEDFDDLPPWVQDKITVAEHNMDAIINYLEEELEMNYSYETLKASPQFISIYSPEDTGMMNEAEYRGKSVKLGKPFRTPGGPKKFSVYVKNKSGNVVKVSFGDPNLRIKNADPARAKSFRARHKCDQKKDRTTPGYWSCNVARYRKALGLTSSRTW